MSTVTVPDKAGNDTRLGADTLRRKTLLSRLLTWYKESVTEPETEREKAEWQQNSF